MADVIYVQNALVALIAQTLYPNGISQSSIVNAPVKVYPGWPTQSQLDADLIIGTHHITVYPTATERNTTRYPKEWQTLSITPATLTMTVNGQQITIGGAMPSPFSVHNMAVMVGGKNYTYAVQPTDTLASIATAIAALLVIDYPGSSSAGAVITLPVVAHIQAAKVGTTGTSIREIRRQEKVFQITAWCDTAPHRDAVVGPVDVALAATQFITLADGTAARIIYKSTLVNDTGQKAKLYRRDLIYTVEYATTQIETDTQIVVLQNNFNNMSATPASNGVPGAAATYTLREVPSGLTNGLNTAYALAHSPIGSIIYVVNGMIQELGVDYSIVGSAITRLSWPLTAIDKHWVEEYRIGSITAGYTLREVPSGLTNGLNTAYALAHIPVGSITYVVNGVIQELGVDYSITGSTITRLTWPLTASDKHWVEEYRTTATAATYTTREVPLGLTNGINTAYALSHSPIGSITYVVNGAIQELGVDYRIVGSAITRLTWPLAPVDRHWVEEYRI